MIVLELTIVFLLPRAWLMAEAEFCEYRCQSGGHV